MSLRRIVRAWYWFVLFCMLAGAGAGFLVGFVTPPSYASTVTVIIAPPTSSSAVTINDIQVVQALAPSYAELASSRTLLDRVIAGSGITTTPDKLASEVSTHVPTGTSLLQITVTDRVAQDAAVLANAIAAELARFKVSADVPTVSGQAVTLNVVDPAIPSPKSLGLGPWLGALIGAAIGLMLAVAFAFVVENIRSADARATSTGGLVPDRWREGP